jgi:mannosylglycoprotein endo-beta-mannosidase
VLSPAAILSVKFKRLRNALKKWKTSLSRIKGLITRCNWVIDFLDRLEEERPLFSPEKNFRRLVKQKYEHLLKAQYNYWRKRCTIRWMKLGEENTKFFHAMATERYRHNAIEQIQNSEGQVVTQHEEIAAVAWICYKERMGTSNGINMQLDLSELLKECDKDLNFLKDPFSQEEMDVVIKKMPPNKAPGPDGFNGLFMKRCWHIIKEDFYNLASEFAEGNAELRNINTSLITLVQKKSFPETMNDLRPISLTNCCLKFLSKMAANRLQTVIRDCIHKNQYGFIRSRTIQDCVAWAFE